MTPFELAQLALLEDGWSQGDLTTAALEKFMLSQAARLPTVSFQIGAKQAGIFSGRSWIEAIADVSGLMLRACVAEGGSFTVGQPVVRGSGDAATVLRVERVLLNELQYLCGIATLTRNCVRRVEKEAGAQQMPVPGVFHTRKILPLQRELAIAAVEAGGGHRHRRGLNDRILFKENHKYFIGADFEKFLMSMAKDGLLKDALIEVENTAEAILAARMGAHSIMLDNFTPTEVKSCLATLPAALQIEVSGGLCAENLASYVLPGVTRMSLGSLTHSVKAIDLSLDIGRPS